MRKNSSKQISWIIIAIIILLLIGAYFFYQHQEAKAPTLEGNQANNSQQSPTASPTPSAVATLSGQPTPSDVSPTKRSGGGEVPAADIQVYEIDYTDSGFSPKTMDVKVNDYIFFTNKSTKDFWPTAATSGGYAGFDAGKNIAPGKNYKFQFLKPGTWKFVDKLNPSQTGTVVVSK